MKKITPILIASFLGILSFKVTAEEPCLASDLEKEGNDFFNIGRDMPSVLPEKKVEVGNLKDDDDCEFYRQAWQMFLYSVLPNPEKTPNPNNDPRLLSYETPYDLWGSDATPNVPKESGGLMSLAVRTSQEKKVDGKSPQIMGLTLKKSLPAGHGGIQPQAIGNPNDNSVITEQADTSNTLVDQNGHPIYYAVHMNKIFASYMREHGYTKNPSTLDPNGEFEVGALELKSSWRIVDPSETEVEKSFYVINANIPSSAGLNDKGKPIFDISHPVQKKLALVGLHVVGVIKGHPEFIWATFEHEKNAPSNNWTFYPKSSDCNQGPRIGFSYDAVKQTYSPPTTVCRENEFDDEAIISLNNQLQSKLREKGMVWQHYKLTGAVWLNKPSENFTAREIRGGDCQFHENTPNCSLLGEGVPPLANPTMETFTQDMGCFDCHSPNGSKLGVSHIFTVAKAYLKKMDTLKKDLSPANPNLPDK